MARVSTLGGDGYGGGATVISTGSFHSDYVSVPDAELMFRGDYHRAARSSSWATMTALRYSARLPACYQRICKPSHT
jgi:hypothetical protein